MRNAIIQTPEIPAPPDMSALNLHMTAPPRPPLPREDVAPNRPPPPETDDEDEVFKSIPSSNQPILVSYQYLFLNSVFVVISHYLHYLHRLLPMVFTKKCANGPPRIMKLLQQLSEWLC